MFKNLRCLAILVFLAVIGAAFGKDCVTDYAACISQCDNFDECEGCTDANAARGCDG